MLYKAGNVLRHISGQNSTHYSHKTHQETAAVKIQICATPERTSRKKKHRRSLTRVLSPVLRHNFLPIWYVIRISTAKRAIPRFLFTTKTISNSRKVRHCGAFLLLKKKFFISWHKGARIFPGIFYFRKRKRKKNASELTRKRNKKPDRSTRGKTGKLREKL